MLIKEIVAHKPTPSIQLWPKLQGAILNFEMAGAAQPPQPPQEDDHLGPLPPRPSFQEPRVLSRLQPHFQEARAVSQPSRMPSLSMGGSQPSRSPSPADMT